MGRVPVVRTFLPRLIVTTPTKLWLCHEITSMLCSVCVGGGGGDDRLIPHPSVLTPAFPLSPDATSSMEPIILLVHSLSPPRDITHFSIFWHFTLLFRPSESSSDHWLKANQACRLITTFREWLTSHDCSAADDKTCKRRWSTNARS